MITKQVIEEIVSEVIKRMELADSESKPRLLVVHHAKEKNQSQINELKGHWHVVEMSQPDRDIPTGFQNAVFLEVNQDLFVKGALGITDTHESLLFSKLILKNCQVNFVLDHSLSEIIYRDGEIAGNKNYVNQLLYYRKQLEEYGVCLSPIDQVLPRKAFDWSQEEFIEKVLTKDHVEAWDEKTITIHPGTLITPLARDVAREKGITILMH
ncbi:hypothetical protein [Virgibacillus oceani]|uniref:Ethanolamine utilization protein n=1 Tax=Virgibacillus oceani TaxID=1479511 RepID=A0A917M7H5_9BACI|nr:hypothetical protein [Virgibacillus oceani]GGG79952.1 hypothetical protein GCM10011398_26630 [Virgibacillus oceani]